MTDDDLMHAALGGPRLERDEHHAGFFDALRRDVLVLRRCQACGGWGPPQAVTCARCGSGDLDWQPSSGTAGLVTWSVVHSPPHEAFREQVPFTTGIVELSEGPWMFARIVGVDARELAVGFRLRVMFVHPEDGESYPAFGPR